MLCVRLLHKFKLRLKKIKAAKAWTGLGAALVIIGAVPNEEIEGAELILVGGIIIEVFAIRSWIKRSNRKKEIEIELVKFNPPCTASINSLGLKIRFQISR